ncbi:TlyA family RNA methyltransferase [Patescibacteria group bacterium]|nr:TlyA family RNA methyltransferase [Patescibacteria group bacterium]
MSPRLDLLVAKRFGLTRTQAAAAIMAGRIKREGQLLTKAGQNVKEDTELEYDGQGAAVSRAGGKLAGALDAWPIKTNGITALDVGSSTGGFTEELLSREAAHVIAVDVGRGQLAWKLRQDDRVTSLEQTDIRKLETLSRPASLAVIDVSFISLDQVLPAVHELIGPEQTVIALFKPQFEVGRKTASKHRGVIKDSKAVEVAFKKFATWLNERGWQLKEQIESPVHGTKGNVERLVWLVTPR